MEGEPAAPWGGTEIASILTMGGNGEGHRLFPGDSILRFRAMYSNKNLFLAVMCSHVEVGSFVTGIMPSQSPGGDWYAKLLYKAFSGERRIPPLPPHSLDCASFVLAGSRGGSSFDQRLCMPDIYCVYMSGYIFPGVDVAENVALGSGMFEERITSFT